MVFVCKGMQTQLSSLTLPVRVMLPKFYSGYESSGDLFNVQVLLSSGLGCKAVLARKAHV